MAEYQISRKYGTDGWLMWEDIDDGYMTGFPSGRTLDSGARYRLRVKPAFEPGYFRLNTCRTREAGDRTNAVWCQEDPGEDYERVNVTPAE